MSATLAVSPHRTPTVSPAPHVTQGTPLFRLERPGFLRRDRTVGADISVGNEAGYTALNDALNAARMLHDAKYSDLAVVADGDRFAIRHLAVFHGPGTGGAFRVPFTLPALRASDSFTNIHPALRAITSASQTMLFNKERAQRLERESR